MINVIILVIGLLIFFEAIVCLLFPKKLKETLKMLIDITDKDLRYIASPFLLLGCWLIFLSLKKNIIFE
tara:strand:- start:464 stop:670 length:207 start_codon:yes stop_codon:yes gene_type:complete